MYLFAGLLNIYCYLMRKCKENTGMPPKLARHKKQDGPKKTKLKKLSDITTESSRTFVKERKTPRCLINFLIDYQTLDQFFHDYAVNLSLGGIFIHSKNPLPVGSDVKLSFALPGLDASIQTTGVVVHVENTQGKKSLSGMGIQFKDLDPKSKALIDTLMKLEEVKEETHH